MLIHLKQPHRNHGFELFRGVHSFTTETILNKTLNHIGITAVRGWRSAAMNTQFHHSGRNCKLSSICLNVGKYVAGILCTATKNCAHYKVEPCNYGVSVWGTVGGKTCFLYPSSGLQLIELSGLFLLLDNSFRTHSDWLEFLTFHKCLIN